MTTLKTFVKTFRNEDDLNTFIDTQEVEVIDVKPILNEDNKLIYVLIAKIKTYWDY